MSTGANLEPQPDPWTELLALETRVRTLADELHVDLATSGSTLNLDGGDLSLSAFEDECFAVGRLLAQLAESASQFDDDVATAARTLRIALGDLLNWALVIDRGARDEEQLSAYERRFNAAWSDYKMRNDARDSRNPDMSNRP